MASAYQERYGLGEGDEYELGLPESPTYNTADMKEAAIVKWRTECFERIGFVAVAALALAMRKDIDREKVERMVAGGCRPVVAMEILL